jgi:hypothetical protein
VRERRLHEPEHGVDVGLEGPVEQLGGDVGYAVHRHLVGRVVHQDVYVPELVDGVLDQELALGLVADVARHLDGLAAGLLDDASGLLGIGLLLREVGDHDVRALPGERERDRPPDSGVAAGDDGLLPF